MTRVLLDRSEHDDLADANGPDGPARFRARLGAIPLSVLGTIVERLAKYDRGEIYPLHQGKSWFAAPFEIEGRASDGGVGERLYHDGPPQGSAALLEQVADTLGGRLHRKLSTSNLQITNGITHGLHLAFGTLLAPGDSVLMLSPQWLFAKGIANVWGARAIEVPYFNAQRPKSVAGITALLDRHVEERSRAIYFNTPNNPTGLALSKWEAEAIGEYARSRNMMIVADNAYEAFDFGGEDFPDPAAEDMFPDITIGLYSFSKTFGWTGFRIGYAVVPPSLAYPFRTLALHSIYCVSTASQVAALQGLKDFDATIDRHRDWVRGNLALVRQDCRIPKSDCVGGFYTLLDLSGYPGGAMRFIDTALDRGVSLAPGSAFGPDCEESLRLCHAVVEEEKLGEALHHLNGIYESG